MNKPFAFGLIFLGALALSGCAGKGAKTGRWANVEGVSVSFTVSQKAVISGFRMVIPMVGVDIGFDPEALLGDDLSDLGLGDLFGGGTSKPKTECKVLKETISIDRSGKIFFPYPDSGETDPNSSSYGFVKGTLKDSIRMEGTYSISECLMGNDVIPLDIPLEGDWNAEWSGE